MARHMRSDDALFRAVIVETYPPNPDGWNEAQREGFTSTYHRGPYTSKGPATTAKTRAENEARDSRERWGRGPTVEAHVEQAEIVWSRVT